MKKSWVIERVSGTSECFLADYLEVTSAGMVLAFDDGLDQPVGAWAPGNWRSFRIIRPPTEQLAPEDNSKAEAA